MTLKNFIKIELEASAKAVLEEHFRSFVDRPTCRWCGAGPMWGDAVHGSVCHQCISACEHAAPVTGYIIKRNGSLQVRTKCSRCNREPDVRKGAPKRGSEYYDICLSDLRDNTECERCGSDEGVEMHHYAPQNVFPDAGKWAFGYLCVPCHHDWHQTMDGYHWNTHRTTARATQIDGPLAPPVEGELVEHKYFGHGRVVRLDEDGAVAVIRFYRTGIRRIVVANDMIRVSA